MNKNTIKKILREGLMLPKANLKNQVYRFLNQNVIGIYQSIYDKTILICTDEENELGFFVEKKEPRPPSDGWETSGAYKSGYTVSSYHSGPMNQLLDSINVKKPDLTKKKEINMAILDWFLDNKEKYQR